VIAAWSDESRLLVKVREGDRIAAEEIVERTYSAVYASLYRLCGDGDLAADLTQETYRKAWEALGSFDGRSQLFTWLYRIAYTTFLNHIRRPRLMTSLDAPEAPEMPDHAPAADEMLSSAEDAERLRSVGIEPIARDLGDGSDFTDLPDADFVFHASAALGRAILVAVVLVLILLYVALDSLRETLLLIASLPIALVGGVLALVLAGETWNVSSLVGLIGLFGIAVQNGLVLVTQTRGLVAEGLDLRAAVREASLGRVRPKLMTAGTAILGLLPMLVLDLHGTEIERPLAIVMVGGLVTSTAFTLLVLPVLLAAVPSQRDTFAA